MKLIFIFAICTVAISNIKAAAPKAADCDCHFTNGFLGGCVIIKVCKYVFLLIYHHNHKFT